MSLHTRYDSGDKIKEAEMDVGFRGEICRKGTTWKT